MALKIKNPRRLHQKYLNQFKDCMGEPLTSTEIINRLNKDRKKGKIKIESFYTQYIKRLKGLALISRIEPNDRNKELLTRFYGIKCKDDRAVYYFFTPQASEVLLSINNLMNKFEGYLMDKKEIIKKINLLISAIMDYEFISYTNQEFIEFNDKEKKRLLKEVYKIEPKNKKGEKMKKLLIEEIKGKRKVEFYKGLLKEGKFTKLDKSYFDNPRNLEFTKVLLKRALRNKPFQMLVKSATTSGDDISNFCVPMFHEAVTSIKLIDERTEDLMNILNQNIQINLLDVLNKESGFEEISKFFE